MTGIDWFADDWGQPGHNVHEAADGSWVGAEDATA